MKQITLTIELQSAIDKKQTTLTNDQDYIAYIDSVLKQFLFVKHLQFDSIKDIPLDKIYFTVKTDNHTFYYESDCTDSLKSDLAYIAKELGEIRWTQEFESITFSNQLPKGILL